MLKEKIKIAISWILVIVCVAVIFWLSSRTAFESSSQSGAILDWIRSIFGDNALSDFIIRKLAHCLEFTGLSLLVCNALYQTNKRKPYLYGVALTSLYAITDELHQLFVEGRSCELRDWSIDTAGAIAGAIGFLVIYTATKKYIDRKHI